MACQLNTQTIVPECHTVAMSSRGKQWQSSPSFRDWTKLNKDHQIQVNSNGSYSVYVRDAGSSGVKEEKAVVADMFWNTLNTIKCGVANFIPCVYFSMSCKALIQEHHTDSKSFGLVVIVCQHNSRMASEEGDHDIKLVGRTMRPKMVKAGRLRIRLVSNDFEADVAQGEAPEMCKTEPEFRGQEFEKQFACRYKLGHIKDGILGKVIVEHEKELGEVTQVFEFNLTRGVERQHVMVPPPARCSHVFPDSPSTPVKSPMPTECARRPIHEIADSLNIAKGSNWRVLAQHLGFSPKEIGRHGSSSSPLDSVVSAYKSRGGTEDEILQFMREVSKHITPPSQKRAMAPAAEERSVRRRLFVNAPADVTAVSQTSISVDSDDEENDEDDLLSDIPLDSLPLLQKGALPLTSSPFIITPPTTPVKAKPTLDNFGVLHSPSMHGRRVFTFEGNLEEEDVSHRLNQKVVSDITLWHLAACLNTDWKPLCKVLAVPETEICMVEQRYRDLKECAYQALQIWKDMFPQRFTVGNLFSALCACGLRSHALKYCSMQ